MSFEEKSHAMKKTLLLICITAVIAYNTSAQLKRIERPDGKTLSTKIIDSIVNKLLDTAEITGLQLGIINDNKIVYLHSYGYKNKAKKELSDTSTHFYAASLAKPLFGYIVMQLVDEGKIDLDKPL